jgi:hypothetical protein
MKERSNKNKFAIRLAEINYIYVVTSSKMSPLKVKPLASSSRTG